VGIGIRLVQTKRTDSRLVSRMANHYSQPKGIVGRNICYAIEYDGAYYGHIVGGSATRFLPGRNAFLDISLDQINNIVNNIFYNIKKVNGEYPKRNFTSFVLNCFLDKIAIDWQAKYGDEVLGFETLVEKPRTGELYTRAGFTIVGETIGYTCKREGGKGTDSWSGKRVWNVDKGNLRPKIVLCKKMYEWR